MSSKRELHSFLASERFAPAILSSERIVSSALTSAGLTKAGWRTGLLGETLVRHRLFKGQLPETLKSLYEHPELVDLREAFEKGETEAEGVDSEIFTYLEDRIESFERADGLIALLHESEDEAIPVPFRLSSGGFKPGVQDSSKPPKEIGVWSEYLDEMDLGDVRTIRLDVPLGPYAEMVEGRSLMLPIGLGIARRNDSSFPEALEALATGDVEDGRILRVEGLKAKTLLAKRLNAKFVGVSSDPPGNSFCPNAKEKLDSFLRRWQDRFGKVLPPMLKSQVESWRRHLDNFRGRDELRDILREKLLNRPEVECIALIGGEGMGKSAMLSRISLDLSEDLAASGSDEASVRLTPWLPGCLLHMGKFGSDPHSVTESLLIQANSMLSEPVEIPKKPRDEDPDQRSAEAEDADDREMYLPHSQSIQEALMKLVEEKGRAFLFVDALDEINVDEHFLSIFPDPLPRGAKFLITGRNCPQVDRFTDRRSGVDRINLDQLDRSEIPPITGVEDESSDGRKFNDEVFEVTKGWTYSVSEIGRRVSANGGVFSSDFILNREETLERMARAWEDEVLEDAFDFLIFEELLYSTDIQKERWTGETYEGLKSDFSSGNYENFFYHHDSPGPRIRDMVSYLNFLGHEINARKLSKALDVVRNQLNFFTEEHYGEQSFFLITTEQAKILFERCLSFALRVFPYHCLTSCILHDSNHTLERICNWMVAEENPELLWRLDLLVKKLDFSSTRESEVLFTREHKNIAEECWRKICKTWSPALIARIKSGCRNHAPSLYVEAVKVSVELGDSTHKLDLAEVGLGLNKKWSRLQVSVSVDEGIEYLEELIEEGGEDAVDAAHYLGAFYCRCDGAAMENGGMEYCHWIEPEFFHDGRDFPYLNPSKGISFLEKAIDLGSAEAKLTLATLLMDEDFLLQDFDRAVELMDEVVASDVRSSSLRASRTLFHTFAIPGDLHDFKRSMGYLEKCIDDGNMGYAFKVFGPVWWDSRETESKRMELLRLLPKLLVALDTQEPGSYQVGHDIGKFIAFLVCDPANSKDVESLRMFGAKTYADGWFHRGDDSIEDHLRDDSALPDCLKNPLERWWSSDNRKGLFLINDGKSMTVGEAARPMPSIEELENSCELQTLDVAETIRQKERTRQSEERMKRDPDLPEIFLNHIRNEVGSPPSRHLDNFGNSLYKIGVRAAWYYLERHVHSSTKRKPNSSWVEGRILRSQKLSYARRFLDDEESLRDVSLGTTLLREGVEAGEREFAFEMACRMLDGEAGAESDAVEGERMLREVAECEVNAAIELVERLLDGRGIESDPEEATRLADDFLKKSKNDLAYSDFVRFWAERLLSAGPGRNSDPCKALRLILENSRAGYESAVLLAWLSKNFTWFRESRDWEDFLPVFQELRMVDFEWMRQDGLTLLDLALDPDFEPIRPEDPEGLPTVRDLFAINGVVAILPVVRWLRFDEEAENDGWADVDRKVANLASSGYVFSEDQLVPWHDPEYNGLARDGHPLYDLSLGLLVRHGICEDPDGLSPKQRFDMARKGGVEVPDRMDE